MSNYTYRIEVRTRAAFRDETESLAAIHQLGVTGIERCWRTNLYFLQGTLSHAEAEALARRLLTDPVTEEAEVWYTGEKRKAKSEKRKFIEVTLLPGVTDPVAENLVRSAHLLGFAGLERAATGQSYHLIGSATAEELARLATQSFANPVIQRAVINEPITPPFVPVMQTDDTVEEVALCNAADQGLLAVSSARRLALDLAEMQAIQRYFQQEEREPTDAEIETLAQTWSEHCVHKTFRAKIVCRGARGEGRGAILDEENPKSKIQNPKLVDGLLRTYIRAATEQVAKPWVRSAFVDNAGVIAFDDQWDLAFKVETHNHPSALEPFGGAHTGVGGVVRDILGISAKPIANTDVLCFGPPDLPATQLPTGVLHPQRIAAGVTHGIEDYGNKMGIPTVNGAILYHPGYTSNPLVFCGCLGLLPRDSHPTAAQPDDLIVVIGGRTGRDGLRGATFSSMEMDHTTSTVAGSAVQIGHPIMEKQVLEVVLRARDACLYHAITDCGAGGLASAVGEMGSKLGAMVDLATVPLKYPGLRPWEIWLSEAQERMVLAVPPASWPQLQAICAGQNVEAVAIGTFVHSGRLTLTYGSKPVADLSMHFLHEGIPQRLMEADLPPITPEEAAPLPAAPQPSDLTAALLALLAHPDIRSKETVIRRYDHEVQGSTAVKPLVGVANHGPSDAAVMVPLLTLDKSQIASESVSQLASESVSQSPSHPVTLPPSHLVTQSPPHPVKGVSLSNGICPRYGAHDPYRMAWAAVDEAMRNAVCVGADPDQVALLDNFCWGKPTLPDRLGSLVRCAQGCYDAAVAYQAPFISGKDSLNNEYLGADGRYHAIPGTLLISALGIVPDVQRTVSMDWKAAGNLLYVIGETRNEIGCTHYQEWYTQTTGMDLPGVVPQPIRAPLSRLRALYRVIRSRLVQACHDCSEGGLAVTLAEMALAGRLGAQLDLRRLPIEGEVRDDLLLFAESLGRFVVEVKPSDQAAFEAEMAGIPFAQVGQTNTTNTLRVIGLNGEPLIEATVNHLEAAWRGQELVSNSVGPGDKVARWQGDKVTMNHPVTLSPSHLVTQSAVRVLILHANGTNRDHDAALACELAGARPEIVHINQLLTGERRLLDYGMVVLPGGFSFGDDLGAGALWALELHQRLGADLTRFAESGRPILGICNGFQALVKSGLLPGGHGTDPTHRRATLTYNARGHFECRWIYLQANPASPSIFTRGLEELIYCPVAHGEGRFTTELALTETSNLIALRYVTADSTPASYPANPNGSLLDIAGVCNTAGNILGLMPHPEDHVLPWQHPRWQRGERGLTGLHLFAQGVRYAQ